MPVLKYTVHCIDVKKGPFFPVKATDFFIHAGKAVNAFQFDVTSHSSSPFVSHNISSWCCDD